MATLPSTSSFAPLATIDLKDSHVLHPGSCNPAMDLVVLLAAPSPSGKGKGKERPIGMVELWRMTGTQVWETDVKGRVAGLAWSPDGLFLSLLVFDEGSRESARIDHLSVHDGRNARSVPVPDIVKKAQERDWRDFESGSRWWRMEWQASDSPWPAQQNGESLMIFDSLPRVVMPEKPQPPNAMLFQHLKKAADEASKNQARHESLRDLPSLLPSNPPVPPDILRISPPLSPSRFDLLTGTFPFSNPANSYDHRFLSKKEGDRALNFARIIDKVSDMLDVVLKGMEVAQHHLREAGKQTMIWREEVETCGEQQGMSKKEVHADLFRLLMTGRCGPAVSEWLGNRLTGRASTITKWEETMSGGYKALQRVINESIAPALERIILLLQHQHAERLKEICIGLCKLMESIRADAAHEAITAVEWIKWLNYEIARSVVHDQSTDTPPAGTHDIKLAWAFLKSGFVSSPIQRSFPQLLEKHPKDLLPGSALRMRSPSRMSLDSVLKETFHRLDGTAVTPARDIFTSPQLPDVSIDSSLPMSPRRGSDESELEIDSPGTVDLRGDREPEPELERHLELEPWVWANTLVEECLDMVKKQTSGETEAGESFDQGQDTLYIQRETSAVEGGIRDVSLAFCLQDKSTLWIASYEMEEEMVGRPFNLRDGEIIGLQYFDEVELAILIRADGKTYLATVELNGMLEDATPICGDLTEMPGEEQEPVPLPIARCRLLEGATPAASRHAMALNGRAGRRVGCVLTTDGRRVEVLDMEEIEDDGEEDDEEDEDQGDEDRDEDMEE